MRRTCFGLVLVASLSIPVAATAADNTVVGVGTGAVAGALVGGPIGAVVGAVAGGYIGANTPSTRSRSRRARAGYRRRSAAAPLPQRARLAQSAPSRAVAPAPEMRAPASEVVTAPPADTTGSTPRPPRSGWTDPR